MHQRGNAGFRLVHKMPTRDPTPYLDGLSDVGDPLFDLIER